MSVFAKWSCKKIENVHNFTYFCSKFTYINPSIIMCISIIATVIVYIYMVTVVFYFIFFLSPLSSDSLSSSNFFLLLYSLKSNNKSIQIIKFFKLILNLDFKFIKPSPLKNKKKSSNPNCKRRRRKCRSSRRRRRCQRRRRSSSGEPKIIAHNSGKIRPKLPSKLQTQNHWL